MGWEEYLCLLHSVYIFSCLLMMRNKRAPRGWWWWRRCSFRCTGSLQWIISSMSVLLSTMTMCSLHLFQGWKDTPLTVQSESLIEVQSWSSPTALDAALLTWHQRLEFWGQNHSIFYWLTCQWSKHLVSSGIRSPWNLDLDVFYLRPELLVDTRTVHFHVLEPV